MCHTARRLGPSPQDYAGRFLFGPEPLKLLTGNTLGLDDHSAGLVVGLALEFLLHDLGDQREDVLGTGDHEGRPVSFYLFQE